MIESFLYPLAFIGALATLALWMLFDAKKLAAPLGIGLAASLLLWAGSIFLSEVESATKLWVASRDLLSIGFLALLMRQARANRAVALALFVGAGFFVRFSYLDILKRSLVAPSPTTMADGVPELLIDLRSFDDIEQLTEDLASWNCTLSKAFHPADADVTSLDDYYLIDAPDARVEQVRAHLAQHSLVDWVEENEKVQEEPLLQLREPTSSAASENSDPLLDQQWAIGMLNATQVYEMIEAQGKTRLSKVKVAILDTGIDADHEDLNDHYVSTRSAYDRDVRGHGTHVGGIVAAVTGNGLGVASLLPAASDFVEITSVKVLSDIGGGTQAGIIKGMIEAADTGADIISMSLGGRSNDKKQKAYNDAVKYCNAKGAIVIVSAGNSNNNAKLQSPANADGVITVAAVDENGKKAAFSSMVQDLQYGLCAPGVKIMSTWPKDQYREASGTSMATPYVSSLVAILKAVQPELDTERVYQILSSTGTSTDQTPQTGKLIQPAAALQEVMLVPTL